MKEITVKAKDGLVDIDRYGASLLSHLEEDVDPQVITYKYGRMVKTGYVDTREVPSKLTIEWLFKGINIDTIKSNIEKVKQKLYNCEITFQCEEAKIYYCIMTSSRKEFIDRNECILTTVFSFEKFSKTRIINIHRENQIVEIGGAKKTPISFYITAMEQVENITINDFKILSIPKGKTVIVDSLKGLITMDSTLYSNKVQFLEFPIVLGSYAITCNSQNVDIKIAYQERW